MKLEDKILSGYHYSIRVPGNYTMFAGKGGVLMYIEAFKKKGDWPDLFIGSSIFIFLEDHKRWVCINDVTVTKKVKDKNNE